MRNLTTRAPAPRVRAALGGLPLLLAIVTLGCAGTLDDPERFQLARDRDGGAPIDGEAPDSGPPMEDGGSRDLEAEASAIFNARACINCHSTALRLGGLDLQSDGVGARVGAAMIAAQATQEACMSLRGQPLVDAANPASSYFIAKLGESPACGTPMPQGGERLSAEQIATLTAWLESL